MRPGCRLRKLFEIGIFRGAKSDKRRAFGGFAVLGRAFRLGLARRTTGPKPKDGSVQKKIAKPKLAPRLRLKPVAKCDVPTEGVPWVTAPTDACVNVQGDPRHVMICG